MDIKLCLKALVDKEKKEVVFAEASPDFVDLLFSFFSLPIGRIMSLISKQQDMVGLECMKNLRESVENLEDRYFCSKACRVMLLSPHSAAANRKYKLLEDRPFDHFLCSRCFPGDRMVTIKNKQLSHYNTTHCSCGGTMRGPIALLRTKLPAVHEGVPFGGLSPLIMTDGLKLVTPSTTASASLVSKHGIYDLIEETFTLGSNEVLKLLKCLLASQRTLTETFLNPSPSALSGNKHPNAAPLSFSSKANASKTDRNITIKLLISKSKKFLCYAEAHEDFVNLLFSFLTLPLGYVAKKMNGSCFKIGCLDHLYNSFMQLDTEEHLKCPEHKPLLMNPKLAPGYGYVNQLLDIEQAEYSNYYYHSGPSYDHLFRCSIKFETLKDDFINDDQVILTVMDPKTDSRSLTRSGGFVQPAIFMISDDLTITPYSPVSAVCLLRKLKLYFDDLEERVVHIGKEEAVHLLLASFSSDCALSNAFITPEQTRVSSELFRYQ